MVRGADRLTEPAGTWAARVHQQNLPESGGQADPCQIPGEEGETGTLCQQLGARPGAKANTQTRGPHAPSCALLLRALLLQLGLNSRGGGRGCWQEKPHQTAWPGRSSGGWQCCLTGTRGAGTGPGRAAS